LNGTDIEALFSLTCRVMAATPAGARAPRGAWRRCNALSWNDDASSRLADT
jgi:hypothetical protein